MALSYVPPGVLPVVEIQATPQVPTSVSQAIPVIIGEATGYQTYSENKTLSGTTPVNLNKKGLSTSLNGTALLNLAVTATNPVTFESISPANYIVKLVSAGTATGDETYSIQAASKPNAPGVASAGTGSNVPVGTHRYAVSYLVDINTGSGTTIYETGLGSSSTITLGTAASSITLSNLGTASPSDISVLGKNIYRSTNVGTNDNPNWSAWHKISTGTAATVAGTVDTATDSTGDVSGNQVSVAGIASGDTVSIQYKYTDSNYWAPTIFSDFNDITAKYGDAFTNTGTINSKASFGAKLAILNGASNVVVVPIANGGGSVSSNWSDALLKLEEDFDGNIIVPLTGDTSVHSLVLSHIAKMKQRNVWKSSILGMDGSGTTTVSADTLRATAQSYNTQDVCLVSPAKYNYFNTYTNQEVAIGGQYAAACLAGMHAGMPLAESLTRKQVAGLSSVGETRTTVGKNQDAQSGLLVIEQIASTGSIRVRHDITTAPGDVNTREYPITLQRNNMINETVTVIDQNIIGQIFADTSAPGKVASIVTQKLDSLIASGSLGAYNGVSAKFATNDPTTIQVRWQYKPIYTVQYVQISFGININSGAITTANSLNLVL
jgi:hypothetical protein